MNQWTARLRSAEPYSIFFMHSLMTLGWGMMMVYRALTDPAALLQFPAFRAMQYVGPLWASGTLAILIALGVLLTPGRPVASLAAVILLSWFWLWLALCYTFAATVTPTIAIFVGLAVTITFALVRRLQMRGVT